MKKQVLLTGGAGYIGSHTAVSLIESGYQVVILDNLCNSDKRVIDQIKKITHHEVVFQEGDVRDRNLLSSLFKKFSFEAVLHFAGLKSVDESIKEPLQYYENNVCGTVTLLEVMTQFKVKRFVFSSSATVYGESEKQPVHEQIPLKPMNPYGKSKYFVEEILKDLAHADTNFSVAILRYFNPVGAHTSGLIGENPKGEPSNLMPYIAQVASGARKKLKIFGDDYPTEDGTGVRDYIHIMDLAEGHVAALNYILSHKGVHVWNLGTGKGHSVLEVVKAFEKASGRQLPYEICDRRPGDVAICYADASKANRELNWQAKRGLKDMCVDAWRWEVNRSVQNGQKDF